MKSMHIKCSFMTPVLSTCQRRPLLNHSECLLSISPLSISSLISFGDLPSTWHPTLKAVPRISLTVPVKSFASDLLWSRITFAMEMTSSRGIDLVCLMFFSFFLSRGGSLSALMTSEEAEGTTETAACRFWIVSFTVTRSPFYCSKQLSAHATGTVEPSKLYVPSLQ